MNRSQAGRRVGLGLLVAAVLALPPGALAQSGSGSLSSGSGSGTGTGTGAGAGTGSSQPGTGNITGAGAARIGDGTGALGQAGGRDAGGRGVGGSNGGQGQDNASVGTRAPSTGAQGPSRLPTDPGVPIDALGDILNREDFPGLSPEQLRRIESEILPRARAIVIPSERSLALDRAARTFLLARNFEDAQTSLREAADAAKLVPLGLVKDLRIMAIATTFNTLGEELSRSAVNDFAAAEDPSRPIARGASQRAYLVDAAMYNWRLAAELSGEITNGTFRAETLYRVVLSQANGSSSLITQRGILADKDQDKALLDKADLGFRWAESHARMIRREIWRDAALVAISGSAAAADSFDRGLQVARGIPEPQFRTDALIRIAEAMARRGRPEEATNAYAEAAQAVASIKLQDPRGIIAGVLIDSLNAVGRFDDARATVALLPDPSRRIVALGALAQSQSERGEANLAREWIDREAPAEYRPLLQRQVDDGELMAVDRSRSAANSGRGSMGGSR